MHALKILVNQFQVGSHKLQIDTNQHITIEQDMLALPLKGARDEGTSHFVMP